jgi:hypothetical protein
MMKTTLEKIEAIKKNGYQLDFANVFNHAFENYKKIALYAGLINFIFTFVICVLFLICFGYYFTSTELQNVNKQLIENLERQKNIEGPILVLICVISIGYLLLTPFSAGFYKMADCANNDKEFKFRSMFSFYKTPYFTNILIATIIIALIKMVISTIVISSLNIANINNVGIIQLTSYLISFLILILTFLTIPLIIFGDLKAVDAIKSSAIIVSKQPLVLIGLLIVGGIASMVGFIGCCIGVFFTIPFMYSMYYAIYTAIIGIDSETELE